MATQLGNLHPKWIESDADRPKSGEGITFDCPHCGDKKPHRITVFFQNPIDGKPSSFPANHARSGGEGLEFKTLSIAPAIQKPCGILGWIEVGKWFTIKDSPIVVLSQQNNRQGPRPVALSPLQTIEGCETAIARAKVLLGDAPQDPVFKLIRENGDLHLTHRGTMIIRTWPKTDDDEEANALVTQLNISVGYYPDEPQDMGGRIEMLEKTPTPQIIIPGA